MALNTVERTPTLNRLSKIKYERNASSSILDPLASQHDDEIAGKIVFVALLCTVLGSWISVFSRIYENAYLFF